MLASAETARALPGKLAARRRFVPDRGDNFALGVAKFGLEFVGAEAELFVKVDFVTGALPDRVPTLGPEQFTRAFEGEVRKEIAERQQPAGFGLCHDEASFAMMVRE